MGAARAGDVAADIPAADKAAQRALRRVADIEQSHRGADNATIRVEFASVLLDLGTADSHMVHAAAVAPDVAAVITPVHAAILAAATATRTALHAPGPREIGAARDAVAHAAELVRTLTTHHGAPVPR